MIRVVQETNAAVAPRLAAAQQEHLLAELEALRRSHRELTDFVENGAVGMHWVGPDGTVLWANQTELDLIGYEREEYVGRHVGEFHNEADVIADIMARLTRGETLRNYPAQLRCKSGAIKDVLISSSVLWENGEFVHTRCFTVDVTERTRAEGHLAFLAEAGDALAASLDYEDALRCVARLSVPRIADWCAIDVVGEDGGLHRLAVVHADPAKGAAAERLRERYPVIPADGVHTAARVRREGRPWADPAVAPTRLAAEARDPEHLALLRELGFGAELVAPLVARGHVLGTITLVSAAPGRYGDPSDLQLVEALARRCALAVDNARLYDEAQAARDRAERLQAITAQLGQRLEADAVLRQVADAAAELLESQFAGVYLLDPHDRPWGWGSVRSLGETFTLAAARGLDESREAYRYLRAVGVWAAGPWSQDGRWA